MSQANDSLRSLITSLGDPYSDKSASVFYAPRVLSDQQLHDAYRGSWLPKKIVNIPAFDATRKWRSWQADQKDITRIEKLERKFGVQQKIMRAKVLARLWGGAAIFIGTNQDAATPLDPASLGKDGVKYLTVLSRREVVARELDQDPASPYYGRPVGYTVTNGRTFIDIHPSRLVIQIGDETPDPWIAAGTSMGWGDSILQSVYTAIQNSDGTAANIASMVFEANVDIYKINGLMEHLGNANYRQRLLDRFSLAQIGKGVSRALLTDTEEEYDRKQIAFTGLPDVLQQFLLICSGASDIPITRLMGQSPAGLSSTGEHDMKNYHDRVKSIQTLELEPAMSVLDDALLVSALGKRPEELYYTWCELEQTSDSERAGNAKTMAETAAVLTGTGLFTPEELRKVVGNQMIEQGIYPGLAEAMAESEQDPNFDMNGDQNDQNSVIPSGEGQKEPVPADPAVNRG